MVDVEVHEEVDVVDHPCEVEGVEQGVVDEVDLVIVEVDEVADEEDSSQEAHQGVDVVDSVIEEADVVDEEDTRLWTHVQYDWNSSHLTVLLIVSLIPDKQEYSAVTTQQARHAPANSDMPPSAIHPHSQQDRYPLQRVGRHQLVQRWGHETTRQSHSGSRALFYERRGAREYV